MAIDLKLRGFFASIYIGIQAESNWTKRIFYLLYLLFTPVSSVFTVIIIYGILGGGFKSDIFYYAIFGALFYFFLADIFFNTAFTVMDDREHYRILKYIIVSRINYLTYLAGRGVAKAILSGISIGLTFLWVLPLFKIEFSFNPFLFVSGILIGFVGAFGLALIFSGYYLLSVRAETSIMDILFGGLFLISGALFPPTVLPKIVAMLAKYFPITSVIEIIRYSLFARFLSDFFKAEGLLYLFRVSILSNTVVFLLGLFFFNLAVKRATKKGYLDMTTAF